jgi:hypothetical protein
MVSFLTPFGSTIARHLPLRQCFFLPPALPNAAAIAIEPSGRMVR